MSRVESDRKLIRRIIDSYDGLTIRGYSSIRFLILRQTFLEEIDQYLPTNGRVLDLGCGFGLFSLYFAGRAPERQMVGVELNEKRVQRARHSAARLGITNAEYHVGNALEWDTAAGTFDAIYMLDVVHHLPEEGVPEFMRKLVRLLKPGGTLILKDVADTPVGGMLFTLALDRLMVGLEEPIKYWSPEKLTALVEELGLDVKRHRMRDILPYPHMLYVCRAPADSPLPTHEGHTTH